MATKNKETLKQTVLIPILRLIYGYYEKMTPVIK